jgi:hypothetical protein
MRHVTDELRKKISEQATSSQPPSGEHSPFASAKQLKVFQSSQQLYRRSVGCPVPAEAPPEPAPAEIVFRKIARVSPLEHVSSVLKSATA